MSTPLGEKPQTILVTGGSGFIGSALVRLLLGSTPHRVINVDKLTYSGSPLNLPGAEKNANYVFEHADICDEKRMREIVAEHKPTVIMHLAAESHVDRSISGPGAFIETNIKGTYSLLEAARGYWNELSASSKESFRFLHVSTDEVYGTLGETGEFRETTPYAPNSPYSASKAGSDHLVRAWHHTFGLPILMTNCSNNYGPHQFPEKLIPVVIMKAFRREPIPVYGQGINVRDWLFVDDHARALIQVVEKGRLGETYNVGCRNERKNIEVVRSICSTLDEISSQSGGASASEGFRHDSLITFVTDRPGHDLRYAIDPTKIENEIGWKPQKTFEEGLKETVKWYLDNTAWAEAIVKEAAGKK